MGLLGGKKQNPYEARTGRKLGTGQPTDESKAGGSAPKPFETLERAGHTRLDEDEKKKRPTVASTRVDAD